MTLKVLVVDDATFIRDLVKRTLRHQIADLETVEAADGERGVALVKQQKPDIILSDWEMPKMGGEEFLAWVRSEPEFQSIPFIMITSRGDREHVIEAVKLGVSDYISKPFSAEELVRKVTKQLKKIGFDPQVKASAAKARGEGKSSLEALTGSAAPADSGKAAQQQQAQKHAQLAALKQTGLLATNNTAPKPKTKTPPSKDGKDGKFKGAAHLRFSTFECDCVIKDLSLQAVSVHLARPATLPTLFDQAAIDLSDSNGDILARLNAYVHSVQAVTPHPESADIKLVARFVDKDPAKMEALSKAIANL